MPCDASLFEISSGDCFCGTNYQQDTSVLDFDSNSQTQIFISLLGDQPEVKAFEVLVNKNRIYPENQWMSLQLNVEFQPDSFFLNMKTGKNAYIAAAKDDFSVYQPKYLIQYWQKFSEFKAYVSCSLFMHMDGAFTCTDNPPGTFYLGLPISSSTPPPLYSCDNEK